MDRAMNILRHGTGHFARVCSCPVACSVGLRVRPASRSCRLARASIAGSSHCPGYWRAPGRRGRGTLVCTAAAKSFYEVLGVGQSASDREIKSAYRKLAMKLHPDVNKAPDAQTRFMEVKVAYETLSDTKQRAEYDRRLRMGGFGGYGSRTGGSSSSSSYGGRTGASSYGGAAGGSGSWGPYGASPNFTQEPAPGVDELLRELEKEFTAWVTAREKGGKGKSLLEELEDLGGELLDFLEESLGIKDDSPAAGASGSSSSGPSTSGSQSAAGGTTWDPRSAAERFDDIWRQYGDGTPVGGSSNNSSSTSGATSGSSGSSARTRTSPSSSASSTHQSGAPSSSASPGSSRQAAGRTDEDDIEMQLQALKKKLNKL